MQEMFFHAHNTNLVDMQRINNTPNIDNSHILVNKVFTIIDSLINEYPIIIVILVYGLGCSGHTGKSCAIMQTIMY